MTFRNHSVQPVTIAGVKGFQVQCLYRDCSDSMWEPMAHAAVFQTRERAERMLKRVKTKASWEYDWSQWGVPVSHTLSVCSAVQNHVHVYSPL
jgi:hypothetical protein